MQRLSSIAITLLLVGAVMSQNLPGGYWTVFSTSQCTAGSEILYQWWKSFAPGNDRYTNDIDCTQLGSTSQYYTFKANQSMFDTSIFNTGSGWNLYITPSDCSDSPIIADWTAVKVGESCAAMEDYNPVGEHFEYSYGFPSCPSDGNGNATFLTYSTFDCSGGATQTISGPVGQCYMDNNGYPRLLYCDNYVAPVSTPADAPMTAPTGTNAPTVKSPATSAPSATPLAKKSDAALIAVGSIALVAIATML